MKSKKIILAAMLLALTLSACGAPEESTDNTETEAALSTAAESSETISEDDMEETAQETEVVTEKETEAETTTETITETPAEETVPETEDTTSALTETEAVNEETVTVTEAYREPADLSDVDIMGAIDENMGFLKVLVCGYPVEYSMDNYWSYVWYYLLMISEDIYDPQTGKGFVSDEDVLRVSHIMFADPGEIPPVPEELTWALEKTDGGYKLQFGDAAMRMVGAREINYADGKYTVTIDVYEDNISSPSCVYKFTLVPNYYYDSSISWDKPFSISDITVSINNSESYYDFDYSDVIIEVSADSANIRSTPDKTVSDNILGTVHKGDRFVAYMNSDDYWYVIEYNGTEAYISHKMVDEVASFRL